MAPNLTSRYSTAHNIRHCSCGFCFLIVRNSHTPIISKNLRGLMLKTLSAFLKHFTSMSTSKIVCGIKV